MASIGARLGWLVGLAAVLLACGGGAAPPGPPPPPPPPPTGPALTVEVFRDGRYAGDDGEPLYELARLRGQISTLPDGTRHTYSQVLIGTRDERGRPDRIAQVLLWEGDPSQATRVWLGDGMRPLAIAREGSQEWLTFSWWFDWQVEIRLYSAGQVVHRSMVTRTLDDGWTAEALPLDGLDPLDPPVSAAAAARRARSLSAGLSLDPAPVAAVSLPGLGRRASDCADEALLALRTLAGEALGPGAWFLRGIRDGIKEGAPALLLLAVPGGQPVAAAYIGASIVGWVSLHVIDGAISDLLGGDRPSQPVLASCTLEDLPQEPDVTTPEDAPEPEGVAAVDPPASPWVQVRLSPSRVQLDLGGPAATVGARSFRYLVRELQGTYAWTSLDPGVVAVVGCGCTNSEDLAPVGPGEAFVSVREVGTGATTTLRVRVRKAIDHVELTALPTSIMVGQEVLVGARALDAAGRPVEVPEVSYDWRVEPPSVAGAAPQPTEGWARLRGLAAGTATLTVTEVLSGETASAAVTVVARDLPIGLEVEPGAMTLMPGAVRAVKVVARWADGHTEEVTSAATLVSTNARAAALEGVGQVRAVEAGQVGSLQATYQGLEGSAAVIVSARRLLAVQSGMPWLCWDPWARRNEACTTSATRVFDVDSRTEVAVFPLRRDDLQHAAYASRSGQLLFTNSLSDYQAWVETLEASTATFSQRYLLTGPGGAAALRTDMHVALDEEAGIAYLTDGLSNDQQGEVVAWIYAEGGGYVAPYGVRLAEAVFDEVAGKLIGLGGGFPDWWVVRLEHRSSTVDATGAVPIRKFAIDTRSRRLIGVGVPNLATMHELDLDSLEVLQSFTIPGVASPWRLATDPVTASWLTVIEGGIRSYAWGASAPRATLTIPGGLYVSGMEVSVAQRRIFALGCRRWFETIGGIQFEHCDDDNNVHMWDLDGLAYLGPIPVPHRTGPMAALP